MDLQQLAYRFAPIIRHATVFAHWPADCFSPLNWLGWDRVPENPTFMRCLAVERENTTGDLSGLPPLVPVCYYSVVESQNYFFLFYNWYHPYDWKDVFPHDHDIESILLVVHKREGMIGLVTVFHLWMLTYVHPSKRRDPPDILSPEMVIDSSGRFCVFMEAQGHGITGRNMRILFSRPTMIFSPALKPPHERARIVTPSAHLWNPSRTMMTCPYSLVNLFDPEHGIASHFGDPKVFQSDGKRRLTVACRRGGKYVPGKAHAPGSHDGPFVDRMAGDPIAFCEGRLIVNDPPGQYLSNPWSGVTA
ncbi:MAG: hypothetical protein V1778_03110 [bacterium]